MSNRKYELMVIFSLKGGKSPDELKEIGRGIITQANYHIASEEEMGRRTLAYPINKQPEGLYQLFYIVPGKEKPILENLLKAFKREKEVLRALAYRHDEALIKRFKEREEKHRKRQAEMERRSRANAEGNREGGMDEYFKGNSGAVNAQ